jgi:hypothetical protein
MLVDTAGKATGTKRVTISSPVKKGRKTMTSKMSTMMMRMRRSLLTTMLALVAAGAVALVSAPVASAIEFAGVGASYTDTEGAPVRQAGAHPDVLFSFSVPTRENPNPFALVEPVEMPHRLQADLPQGLLGDPTAVPSCSESGLTAGLSGGAACPIGSQVGYALVYSGSPGSTLPAPVYNIEPPRGAPGLFAFNVLNTVVRLTPSVRAGDYGITMDSGIISQGILASRVDVTLWGVPADPAHDSQRTNVEGTKFGSSSQSPRRPFLNLPTSCPGVPEVTTARLDGWDSQGVFTTASFSSDLDGVPFIATGCDELAFEPTTEMSPTSRAADAPTGLAVDLRVPQSESPDGLAAAHVKDVVVTLPKGMAVNPSSADGLGGCSLTEIGLRTDAPVACPDSSKIGTLEVTSPVLEGPLPGSLYLAQQDDNPFGSLLALYLVVDSKEHGILMKIPGRVDLDPSTGQVRATFNNNPQVPFDRLKLSFTPGPRAPLRTPDVCGTYTTDYTLTSWSGKTVQGSDSFTVDQNCAAAGQFTPGFAAGTANPAAGKFSAFDLRLTRQDGQQNLASLDVAMPEGLSAKLAGVPLCPENLAATGACSAASQIGVTTIGSGAGASPVYIPQPGREPTALYLAGPYKGGPYSLIAKVPAQAGPFDLGTVVVRNAIHVDRSTARVSVKSDPLPQILQGIPISYRDVRVEVNKPGFMLNPTSCEPMAVHGAIGSNRGAVAHVSSRFQAADCASLGFKPSLKLKVSGATKRGGYPKLRAELKAKPGEANIAKVSVALPHSEFLAQEHIKTICTRVQYAAKACPSGSVYGWARAFTPLLDQPLEGPVYLRSSSNPLPDLVASLDGQIHIDLAGRIDSKNGGVRSTFEAVPDAPVSKFVLTMQGGKKGLLVNSRDLCAGVNKATVKMEGQNGKTYRSRPAVGNSCSKKAKRAFKRHG